MTHQAPDTRLHAWRQSLLLAVAALLACLFFLQVDGTFATWTLAQVQNDNTTATDGAVVLSAATGATSCRSDSQTANAATCTSMDVYGGLTTSMMPGDSRRIDVVFSNVGTAPGSSFVLAPLTCTSTATLSGFTATNLCTATGELGVDIACSPGAAFQAAQAWTDLRVGQSRPPTASLTHTATGQELAPGASWTCRIQVTLLTTSSQTSQGVQVSQNLDWVLLS